MASEKWITDLCEHWDREAHALDRAADQRGTDYSAEVRKLMRMHARVKRGTANELRIEARKVRRG